jgi:hypothetical protein
LALTHEDLIKPESFRLAVPREGPQEVEEQLADVSKWGEILALDDDQLWAKPLCLRCEHQLPDADASGVVVACREDVLLANAEGQRFERRVLVLVNLRVEAVVVLKCAGTLLVSVCGGPATVWFRGVGEV